MPIDEVPDLVKQAFISAEDKNFYTIPASTCAASLARRCRRCIGGRLRGASTITQQVMKNFLLSSDRSVERKVKELILASRLERTLDKDQILELYLNEIFLGQNSFGVAAAAQVYFNKSLTELRRTRWRCWPRCRRRRAASPGARQGAPDRAAQLCPARDGQNGYITGDEAEAAKAEASLRSRTATSPGRASCRNATISPTRSAAS